MEELGVDVAENFDDVPVAIVVLVKKIILVAGVVLVLVMVFGSVAELDILKYAEEVAPSSVELGRIVKKDVWDFE